MTTMEIAIEAHREIMLRIGRSGGRTFWQPRCAGQCDADGVSVPL